MKYPNDFAIKLLKKINLKINDQIIDEINNEILDVKYKYMKYEKYANIKKLLKSKYENNFCINTEKETLYIPLPFYFAENNDLFLPLIALLNDEVIIQINFNNMLLETECYELLLFKNENDNFFMPQIKNKLIFWCITLNDDTKNMFIDLPQEYLFQQYKFFWTKINENIKINLSDAIKDIFILQTKNIYLCNDDLNFDFNYALNFEDNNLNEYKYLNYYFNWIKTNLKILSNNNITDFPINCFYNLKNKCAIKNE